MQAEEEYFEDALDPSTLSETEKSNGYEMDYKCCGIDQVTYIFVKGRTISERYCQYCGHDVEIDYKTMDQIMNVIRDAQY